MATVLIVGSDGPLLEPVAGELEAHGYAVLRAPSGGDALVLVQETSPDAIIVSAGLPGMESAELCRLLRREARVTPHTAILIAGALPSRDARLAALRAGASDIVGAPLDAAELRLKLDAHAQLKALAEQMQSSSLVDWETGLYNFHGLARRIEELGALSVRTHTSMACVVLAPEVEDQRTLPEVAAFCAQAIKSGIRHSDVPGRITPVEFAVVAPRTSQDGAVLLTQRLAGVIRHRSREAARAVPSFRLRTGYDAVGNLAYAPASASDLLMRARRAWHDAERESP